MTDERTWERYIEQQARGLHDSENPDCPCQRCDEIAADLEADHQYEMWRDGIDD